MRVVLQGDAVDGLDPTAFVTHPAAIIVYALYSRLVEMSPQGDVEPGLASSWSTADGGTQYTFHLRKGVTFSDGQPLTSEDVKFTLLRDRNSPESVVQADFTPVKEVLTPNDLTVIVVLSRPYAPFLPVLTDPNSSIESAAAVKKYGNLKNNPVGTGPFILQSWVKNQRMILVRNPHYWQPGLPYLNEITITYQADANAAVASLEDGQVDFVDNVEASLVPTLKSNSSVRVIGGYGGLVWEWFMVNQQVAPFNNALFRRAVFEAIDKQAIVTACVPVGATVLNGGFLPESYWAGTDTPIFTGNVSEAKALLKQSGISTPPSITISASPIFPQHVCAAQVIQSDLQKIGLKVNIKTYEFTTFNTLYEEAKFQAITYAFSGHADPDYTFSTYYVTGAAENYTHFSDPKLDELAVEARTAQNRTQRAELYREAQKELVENGPVLPLFNFQVYAATSPDVHGFVWNTGNVYNTWQYVWLSS